MSITGNTLAILGACLAAGMSCIGSAKGTGMVGEAAAGLTSEKPEASSKCMIYQVLPGTQGLYGFATWFIVMLNLGVFGGQMVELSLSQGWNYLVACLPMAVGGFPSAILQGRVAVGCISIVGKKPNDATKGVIYCIIVEFYAILSLLTSLLIVLLAL